MLTTLYGTAAAQNDFSDKPVRIIVPYSAGTGSDVIARVIAQGITAKTGKAIVVENQAGGGSLIGTRAVAKAAPDGYTLLIAANPVVIVPSQSIIPPYDPIHDFVPVAKVAIIPLVLTVSPALKIRNVQEFIAYVRTNPGKLNYGSSGPGTISQQEMERFKQAMGLDIPEIPYKSTAQAMTDLIGGTLSVFPVVVPLVSQHVQNGRANAIAVLDRQRSPLLPEIPAITEEPSVSGYTPTPVWYGFMVPAHTSERIVSVLADLIRNAVALPDVQSKLTAQGAQTIMVEHAQFSMDLKTEYDNAIALAETLQLRK